MFENVIHQIGSKNEWLLLPASFTAKTCVGFCLNTRKRFFLEASFYSQYKELRFF